MNAVNFKKYQVHLNMNLLSTRFTQECTILITEYILFIGKHTIKTNTILERR